VNLVAAGDGQRTGQDRGMTTVQLRRYVVEPGRMDDFLAWFPTLLPVREKYGFRLLFALAEREHHTFTWAVSCDGDEAAFTEQSDIYNASPERAAVFRTFPQCISSTEIGFVEDALAPRPGG
jgi:hypothetical protein